MGVQEQLLEEYLRLTTDLHPDETDRLIAALHNGDLSPEELARRLAREVVSSYHGPATADRLHSVHQPASSGIPVATGPG